MTTSSPIAFHPFRSNILDYVGNKNLVTHDNRSVGISQDMRGQFTVTVNGEKVVEDADNLAASAQLCELKVCLRAC